MGEYTPWTVTDTWEVNAKLERLEECLTSAEWNLAQCQTDCNDRSRALDRMAEALEIIRALAALVGEETPSDVP